MNRKVVFFGVLALGWILLLANVGLNIFSVVLGILFSVIWFSVVGGLLIGIDKSKQLQYFANKYDEEYKK